MMSDWSKTRSFASEDVGPNHMMSCVGGFSDDRDPSLDVFLDTGYSDLDYMSSLAVLDSGLFLDSMVEPDSIESSQDFDMAALEQLNLHSTSLQPSNIQNSYDIGRSPRETTVYGDSFFLTRTTPSLERISSSQYCINQPDTCSQGCSKSTNSQRSHRVALGCNVERTPFENSWPKLKISCLPAEKSNYQQSIMYSFNSTPATKPLSRKWTPRKRRSPFTESSTSFKTQKIGITSSPTKRYSCSVSSCSNIPDKGKGIARVVDPQEAVSLLEQSILPFSEFSQRKATALLSQLKQLIDDERLYGKPQDDSSDTGPTSVDSFSQECFSDSEVVGSDCISENTSISSTPRQTYRQESAGTDAELIVHQPCAKRGVKSLFHCTFNACNFSTHSSSDWKRHEEGEKHWPQKRFMCLECPTARTDLLGNLVCEFCLVPFLNLGANARAHYLQCASARENNRTFARQDHLIQHLREKHRHVNISQVASAGEFGVVSMWPRQCGFCGRFFESWSHRMEHVGQHYREGETISSWKLPFPRPKDFRPSGHAPQRKNDDDDSSDDSFDGKNGPYSRKKPAHSSSSHNSSGVRSSDSRSNSTQGRGSSSQRPTRTFTTKSQHTLEERLQFSADRPRDSRPKNILEPRANRASSLTLKRYLNDTETPSIADFQSCTVQSAFLANLAPTSTDRNCSNKNKASALSFQNRWAGLVLDANSKTTLTKRSVVVKISPQEGPRGHLAQEFVYKHRNNLCKGIFWLHSCLEPGLKNSLLDILIRSIEQGGMNSHHVIQFFHIWSRQFYENLGGKVPCLASLILSLSCCKSANNPKFLSILLEASSETTQDSRKSALSLAALAPHMSLSIAIGIRAAHNSFESHGQKHTLTSLGWSSNSELLKLYKFVVRMGKKPNFELLPLYTLTPETPAMVYLGSPRNVAESTYACQYPGWGTRQSVFSKAGDLERHYENVHADEKDYFPCDYPKCGRATTGFTRKHHYRDHLRDFHQEDIGSAKGEKNMDIKKWLASQQTWLADRKISAKHWRCAKCLFKHYIAEDGWDCERCRLSCGPDRIKARQCLKVADDDRQHSSDANCGKDLDAFTEMEFSPSSQNIYSSMSRADVNESFQLGLSGLILLTSRDVVPSYDQKRDEFGRAKSISVDPDDAVNSSKMISTAEHHSLDANEPQYRNNENLEQWELPQCIRTVCVSRPPVFNPDNCSCTGTEGASYFNGEAQVSQKSVSEQSGPETGLNEALHRRLASFHSDMSYQMRRFLLEQESLSDHCGGRGTEVRLHYSTHRTSIRRRLRNIDRNRKRWA